MDYQKIEEEILKEKPYNWKRHFLFNLPEMFYFVLKVAVILYSVHLATWALASALIEKLPAFCAHIVM